MNDIFSKNLILDGGTGSLLIARANLAAGYPVERLNVEKPDAVLEIQKEYVKSGSDVIYTNTLTANPFNFDDGDLKKIISGAIAVAKNSGAPLVALDIGPLGKVVGQGGVSFFDAVAAFERIVELAEDQTDLIVIETMTSLAELRAAIIAVKNRSRLPLMASMSFSQNLRTFFGTSVRCFAAVAEGLGVDCLGANCSLGPVEMLPVARELLKYSPLPVFIKPNAGMPKFEGGKTVYDIDKFGFYAAMKKIKELGVDIIGGCCGTTPEYIKLLAGLKNDNYPRIEHDDTPVVCSAVGHVALDGFKIVGERINPTGKKHVQEALRRGDTDFLLAEAVKQTEQGADILDVNTGVSGLDEAATMNALIDRVQDTVQTPLQIDSSKPEVIEGALLRYHGKAVVNSVNGTDESLNKVLPLVKKFGAAVVGLTLDEAGIPDTAAGRVAIAQKIIAECQKHGIKKSDIIIDVLTMSEASQKGGAKVTLDALLEVKKLGVKTILGISNVSYGMPNREDINAKFLEMARARGLDIAIVNPAFIGLSGSALAEDFLNAKPSSAENYIAQNVAANAPAAYETASEEGEAALKNAVITGQAGLCQKLAERLLKEIPPLELAKRCVIPALDEVGALYEAGRLFLPQLIAAAEAAKGAFFEISKALERSGIKNDNAVRFVLATVKGDIHDIGKNIVKTVVSNYGFTVIDLGRDVDCERVLDAVRKNYPCVLGLSALMTTTAQNLADTVFAVRREFSDIPVICGGAVLNADFAKGIGAIYCKDANDAVAVLRKLEKDGNLG